MIGEFSTRKLKHIELEFVAWNTAEIRRRAADTDNSSFYRVVHPGFTHFTDLNELVQLAERNYRLVAMATGATAVFRRFALANAPTDLGPGYNNKAIGHGLALVAEVATVHRTREISTETVEAIASGVREYIMGARSRSQPYMCDLLRGPTLTDERDHIKNQFVIGITDMTTEERLYLTDIDPYFTSPGEPSY